VRFGRGRQHVLKLFFEFNFWETTVLYSGDETKPVCIVSADLKPDPDLVDTSYGQIWLIDSKNLHTSNLIRVGK
jgi:hypothetical protein